MTGSWALLAGVLLAAGMTAVVIGLLPSAPRLDAALERVGEPTTGPGLLPDVGPVSSRSERLGALLYRATPLPLSAAQRRALRLQDKPIAEFYADKAVMAVVGALVPALVGAMFAVITGSVGVVVPALASVVGLVAGFFVPDLLLGRAAGRSRSGALDALLVYIDLVTLERLANASATQALHNAAALSQVSLFVQIRTALDRARLEQQPPYAELRRLAVQLDLPELADVADVMQLDETGAALSGALQARVRELRDAHLTQEQITASAAAEGMTLYMTLPAMIFALIFLGAALLQIALG